MIIFNKDVKLGQLNPEVDRKILCHSPQMMVCEIFLKKGSVVPDHSHPHEQATYLVSGRLRFTLDGETKEIGPRDAAYCGPNQTHAVTALEDSLVMDFFAPRRDDFL